MTDDTERREGGAWIGLTNNQSDEAAPEEAAPRGHRQGDDAGDDDVRRAGQNR
jgi:hypothetical protein